MSTAARFELDAGVRVREGGRLLVGGIPPRLVRLSEAGAGALQALLAGEKSRPAAALAPRLVRSGLLHPTPDDGIDDPEVTTIVPVLNGGESLGRLVEVLREEGPVIVVDDGSTDGSGRRAESAGAQIVRHDAPLGPAAARNAGLAASDTNLVAFLDADCEAAPGWRRGLAGLLVADPELALIAPRVRSAPGASALARYEEIASPLDLGPAASLVGRERRISYLPAAALLGRRDTLIEIGGFDESMRYGEDVDLTLRLLGAGKRVRYAPSREIRHRPRPSITALAAQRAGYGSSAPELAQRHGSATAPLRPGRHAVMVWIAAAIHPAAAAAALCASLTIVASKGRNGRSRFDLTRIALRGHVDGGGHLARVLLREWLPISLVLAIRSRRVRRALLAAAAVEAVRVAPAADDARGLAAMPALRVVDHSAYAYGLWRGILRLRDPRSLLPASPTK